MRRRKKENTVALADDWEGTEENEYDENKDQLIALLRLCIEKLPETRKNIVMGYYYAKYKMETIAEKYRCLGWFSTFQSFGKRLAGPGSGAGKGGYTYPKEFPFFQHTGQRCTCAGGRAMYRHLKS